MNKHTKEWLLRQPTWSDQQVAVLVSVALIVGWFLGWIA